jgi:hypothetical protein
MNRPEIGLIVQGAGILITAVAMILLVRLQPVPVVMIVIGIGTFIVGHFIRKGV